MIIYLSGPITGIKDYKKNFAEAEAELERQGHVVINPAMLPSDLGDCDKYMQICLPMIDVADAVVMLEGWEDSRGACREWGYAMGLDKIVVKFDAFREEKAPKPRTSICKSIINIFFQGGTSI